MKKVLHFTIANISGGVTKFVLNLWKYIDKERFHFDFVSMVESLDYADELEREGCKIYYLSTYAEDNKEQFVKEVEEILDNGYDIVHLHTNWWRGFTLEEIAKRKGIKKVIVHSHNTGVYIKENQSREAANKLHFEQRELLTENIATDFIACSKEAAEWLYGDRIPQERVKIVPNAIDVENYKYDFRVREEYRKKLKLKPDDYVIGHVGRFAYQKNHEFLLEIFEALSYLDERAKLMLIGVGELEEKIRNKVSQKGLGEKVLFLGKREDVSSLMQAMDLFVFPSRFEGFGIVLIEAQAAGLHCIASNKVPEIAKITDNIQILPLEKDMWVEDMLEYSNGYERKDMTKILKEDGYGMDTLVNKIEEIYDIPLNLK